MLPLYPHIYPATRPEYKMLEERIEEALINRITKLICDSTRGGLVNEVSIGSGVTRPPQTYPTLRENRSPSAKCIKRRSALPLLELKSARK